jgi:cytochrome c-type biogenesis protein CcmF
MPFGPLLAWKRGDILGVAQRLMAAFGAGLVMITIVAVAEGSVFTLAPFGIGLALFIMMGAMTDIAERIGLLRAPLSVVRQRAAGLPRSTWGTAFAHFGIAVTLLGIVSVSTWATERIVAVKVGQSISLSGFELTFDGLVQRSGANYRELGGKFTVRQGSVAGRNDGADEAQLRVTGDHHHRGSVDDARLQPTLSVAGRC